MRFHQIDKAAGLRGEVAIPGDKSISHRAVMFGSLALGTTEITNFLQGADCLSTISCFQKLGITIDNLTGNENEPERIIIHGKGLNGLSVSSDVLDVGNSGTTIRLISGILAAQPFESVLTGDASIQKRPMKRIMEPLSEMGADVKSLSGNDCAPLRIMGQPLHSIHYHSKVASAQVKSAILLAGLYSDGITKVTEPIISRNHSELMLRTFGAKVWTEGTTAILEPHPSLEGQKINVPGDISSAAYFIAAGLIVPGSDILIKNVGINPTRDGILKVAKAMGGKITLLNEDYEGEPRADIHVAYSELHGITIEGDIIPTLIDELPIIAVMAAAASGTTLIKDAAELKVKESNRIDVMVENLSAMGCSIEGTEDGMRIEGGNPLNGSVIDSYDDHRIAMSFAIAALIAHGESEIKNSDCVSISYPSFYSDLQKLY
ncbi:3-phosphoshikimate 1-carboxyvinyltransferase [Kineothrix sp. MB12-C1]|uniref:3-phosphoshikimate 1-carboxyvinyltransferase n=1 Tax=Kineothrix sp. MB12-C1 TaxID=3070215 RepID=UPI0027D2A5D7|nr:3-phosphoshikimate 1-carboxyvinyltransferase [Kineothrix sp. MB12-C1]WMC92439.1 3-phosphoshikimate 1-carboxyvinyltransferase [Kineothrix sp. MB12-C1]